MNDKILLVEDNEMNRTLVKDLLEADHYNVLIAKDSQEAISKVKNTPPDLILMDIGLPEKNGIEVTKQIKNIESISSNLPIVALTAHATQQEKKKFKEIGIFSGIITKPIDTRTFPDKIKKFIHEGDNGEK